MKLVTAVIRPQKLAAVQRELAAHDIDQVTVTNLFGGGHERGTMSIYRGMSIEEKLLARVKLEIAVEDGCVDDAVEAIQQTAKTGQVGDGVIWVLPLERAIRIRTGVEESWSAKGETKSSTHGSKVPYRHPREFTAGIAPCPKG